MAQKSYFPLFVIGAVFILAFSACTASEAPAPTLDVNEIVMQVAGTLQMEYTQTALALPTATYTPESTVTPLTSPTLSQALPLSTSQELPLSTPTVSIILPDSNPTATPSVCYASALVSETIPSGSKLDPGERFVKTWQIKNTGTCDWTREFKITFVDGYDFQGADTTRIREKVTAGSTVEVSMSIDAPNDTDSYSSSWQMATDEGVLFGQVFTIEIKVK